jgi:hypothetical protein
MLFLSLVMGYLWHPLPRHHSFFSPFPHSLSPLLLTHSNACNIGSTTQNSLIWHLKCVGLLFDTIVIKESGSRCVFHLICGKKSLFQVFHSDTHSNACNIGSKAQNSLVEQPIGVLSMLAYYLTLKLEESGSRCVIYAICGRESRFSDFSTLTPTQIIIT